MKNSSMMNKLVMIAAAASMGAVTVLLRQQPVRWKIFTKEEI